MLISVIISTIDRVTEVERCVFSLEQIHEGLLEILILENAPERPWRDRLLKGVPRSLLPQIKIFSLSTRLSATASRNYLSRHALGEILLVLDDDAYILNSAAICLGQHILANDPLVGSIAFVQCNAIGELPPGFAQPAPRDIPCLTCGFSAYGAMIRKNAFDQLGGFNDLFGMYGEENEFCKRMWAIKLKVVFVPNRSICHEPSPVSRNVVNRAVMQARNVITDGLLNEPLFVLPATIPLRAIKAWKFLKNSKLVHQQSVTLIFSRSIFSLIRQLPCILIRRKAIPLGYHRQWQQIKKGYPAYDVPV